MTTGPANWQFWIDVGGTFTDCLAVSPSGDERWSKILSSGLTKGTCQSTFKNGFVDSNRAGAVDGFFNDATIWQVSSSGEIGATATVTHFAGDTGRFELDRPLFQNSAQPSHRYEIDCGLTAPLLAIHFTQQVPINQPLMDCHVDLGTTRGTNALLTRTGARTALVTSLGFKDFLLIGDQARPNLFELAINKQAPLFETSIEIDERVLADGTVERIPDPGTVRNQLLALKQAGIQSLAICFMFGFQYPQHELLVAQIAEEIGFKSVKRSSLVAPIIKIVPRGETTVLDAWLDPIIADYLDKVRLGLSENSQLRLMTSGGGLVSRTRFSGKDSVLSGPAGGVVGAARVAQQAGFERMIGFDMGGTSTDVSRFDGRNNGQFERTFETQKAGVRIVTPMLAVETVAAGGGSVCWFDGAKLLVGPHSAGADPGPACYGRGGPLTITDVNCFLGRIQSDLFPFELDRPAVIHRLDQMCGQLTTSGHNFTPETLAAGFLKIANHNMASAIQTVSVAKGYDPAEYGLMSFGGAGSQHCCAVADQLGMAKILDHPHSSLLSAVGIRLADQKAHAVESILEPWSEAAFLRLNQVFKKLATQVRETLVADGNATENIESTQSLDLRFVGTEPFLTVVCDFNVEEKMGVDQSERVMHSFLKQHQQFFGYVQDRPVEIVSARVDATVAGNRLQPTEMPISFKKKEPNFFQSLWVSNQTINAGGFYRSDILSGDLISGPAVIAGPNSTTIVDEGWQAKGLPGNVLLLEKTSLSRRRGFPARPADTSRPHPDPIQLEIFNRHFASIARQMGESLQKTSTSVNVKERLDFSCAIFTADGSLVVNAPHIPVHLGAMSETVRAIIRLNPDVNSGEVFVTNDPYEGGSHLPDVTVVTPVFDPGDNTQLWFWVASRSHHAEIGGMAPGSMPANATRLGQEGVLIQNFRLIDRSNGCPPPSEPRNTASTAAQPNEHFDQLREILTAPPYPSRSPDENIADVRAQVVANQTGMNRLLELVQQTSAAVVQQYMEYIQSAAEQKVRTALQRLPDGTFRFADALDNGATIRVQIKKSSEQSADQKAPGRAGRPHLHIDFTGTDPVLNDNLNANRAIVASAVMYVMRLLIDEDIPLNEGVMKPVTITLPECFLNPSPAANPSESPALVGGNVETSQRVVDVLLGALGLAAASQGTMNNWLMGSDAFGYYETIGGGSGATANQRGADAVHSHMTNTRLTDPEILESRYPVVLREFSIRRGSGGHGRHAGGDGMIREIEFCESLTVSLLTSRRNSAPYGMQGGAAGAPGLNLLIQTGQAPETLPSRCEIKVHSGDRLRLETPGGGGWGQP